MHKRRLGRSNFVPLCQAIERVDGRGPLRWLSPAQRRHLDRRAGRVICWAGDLYRTFRPGPKPRAGREGT